MLSRGLRLRLLDSNCAFLATGELERRDPSAPVEGAIGFQILSCVPEGAIINRINCHCAVITPAVQRPGLRSAAGLNDVLSLHCAESVGGKPTSVTNTGLDSRT